MRELSFHDKSSFSTAFRPKNHKAEPQPVYTIYSYSLCDEDNAHSRQTWKRHESLEDREEAMSLARSLLKSHLFSRIDIKKKFFDPHQNRTIEITEKRYDALKPKNARIKIMMMAFGLTIAGLLTLGMIAI